MSARGQLIQSEDNNTSEDDKLTTVSAITKEKRAVRIMQRFLGPIADDSVFRRVANEILKLEKENPMHYIPCILCRQRNAYEPRCLRLMFLQKVSSPVLTSCLIKGEGGNSIKVALVDSQTEEVVKSGPEATAEVEILVLKGDYAGHEAFNGKSEDFNNRIVSKMEGKTSVLQGATTLRLKEGISSIDNLSFTQNSGWTRILKLCLGARAVNSFPGTTIEPAETESFDLKDNRVTAYAKKEVPSLLDKVSGLKHIGRGITKRLNNGSIKTVKDLLVVLNTNPQRLQEILKVSTKTWEEVTDHAKTCIIDDKAVHVYFDPDSQQKCGAVFDVIGQVKGSLKESRYFPMNMLSDVEQKDAQRMVVRAFEHWEKVGTYKDVNSLLEEFPQTLASTMTENPNQFISCYSPLFDTWEEPGYIYLVTKTWFFCTVLIL
ncbi:hypothetical protein POM88_051069 [Heracleum sosnowskyi]|uniref:Uncharacterized protein n=1 Tax=Heracleum sosnowskyi TaxID=360622 RepID=A0AAD8M3D4_9APIA|nr:hypothetical protein POM88_051069 [Heracleum sosnowskyi]